MHTRSHLAEGRDESVVDMAAAVGPAFDVGILDLKSVGHPRACSYFIFPDGMGI